MGFLIHDYLQPVKPRVFDFVDISAPNLAESILNLGNSPSARHDGIMTFMLKLVKHELVDIFNFSIHPSSFQEVWKDAIVTSLFKSGNASNADNYGPILLLSLVAKVWKHSVHKQCYNHLSEYNTLNETVWWEKGVFH